MQWLKCLHLKFVQNNKCSIKLWNKKNCRGKTKELGKGNKKWKNKIAKIRKVRVTRFICLFEIGFFQNMDMASWNENDLEPERRIITINDVKTIRITNLCTLCMGIVFEYVRVFMFPECSSVLVFKWCLFSPI